MAASNSLGSLLCRIFVEKVKFSRVLLIDLLSKAVSSEYKVINTTPYLETNAGSFCYSF